mgnify:CR=1 FL=1
MNGSAPERLADVFRPLFGVQAMLGEECQCDALQTKTDAGGVCHRTIGEVEALDSSLSTATDDEGAQSVLGGSVGESIPDYASAEESKLYVGNLPWSCTSEELAEVFQKVGGVEMVEVFLSSSSSV